MPNIIIDDEKTPLLDEVIVIRYTQKPEKTSSLESLPLDLLLKIMLTFCNWETTTQLSITNKFFSEVIKKDCIKYTLSAEDKICIYLITALHTKAAFKYNLSYFNPCYWFDYFEHGLFCANFCKGLLLTAGVSAMGGIIYGYCRMFSINGDYCESGGRFNDKDMQILFSMLGSGALLRGLYQPIGAALSIVYNTGAYIYNASLSTVSLGPGALMRCAPGQLDNPSYALLNKYANFKFTRNNINTLSTIQGNYPRETLQNFLYAEKTLKEKSFIAKRIEECRSNHDEHAQTSLYRSWSNISFKKLRNICLFLKNVTKLPDDLNAQAVNDILSDNTKGDYQYMGYKK